MRNRTNSSLSDNELAEALKLADYKDIVRQLNNFYGQGLLFQIVFVLKFVRLKHSTNFKSSPFFL